MCGNPFRPPKPPAPPPPPPAPPKVKESTPTVSNALTQQTAPTKARNTSKGDTNGVRNRDEGSSRVATRKRAGRRQLRIPLLPEARRSLIQGEDSGINLPT